MQEQRNAVCSVLSKLAIGEADAIRFNILGPGCLCGRHLERKEEVQVSSRWVISGSRAVPNV